MTRLAGIAGGLLLLMGCAHLEPPRAPRPGASLAERTAAFHRLRSRDLEVYTLVDRAGLRVDSGVQGLRLQYGYVVRDPRELLPVVAPGSATARAAHAYERRNREWAVWGSISGTLFFGGLGATIHAAATGGPMEQAVAGVAISGLLGVGTALVAAILAGNSDKDRVEAFRNYDRDLRAFLLSEAEESQQQEGP